MKIIPTKSQWHYWSLPAKASYAGAWLVIIGVLYAVISFIVYRPEHPIVSILSVDSLLHKDSLETRFVIKNTGRTPLALLIKGEAFIGDSWINVRSEKLATESQSLMPDQIVRYRGLTIRGATYKNILDGSLTPNITQTITLSYGTSEKKVNGYSITETVKLDVQKLMKSKGQDSQSISGLWLLKKSQFR